MFTRTIFAAALASLLSGCASPPPSLFLRDDRPTNPSVGESPLPDHSDTLAINANNLPVAIDEQSMAGMQGMQHGGAMDHEMPGMPKDTPSTIPGENAAPSVPRPGPTTDSSNKELLYTCPMHKQIESKTPGKCPICGMTLIPKRGEGNPPAINENITSHEGHGGQP